MMVDRFTDRQADQFLVCAFIAWALSVVHPIIGMMIQFPLVVMLVSKANVKAIPALMILMLGKHNVYAFTDQMTVLRFGITLTTENLFVISTFLYSIVQMLKARFSGPLTFGLILWLPAVIPAIIISLAAKSYGLAGMWSVAIMDFLAPSMFFWGVCAGSTYGEGKEYFIKRLMIVMLVINFLHIVLIAKVFTFTPVALSICIALYYLSSDVRRGKLIAVAGAVFALISLVFLRYMYLLAADSEKTEYSTFSSVAVVLLSVLLAKYIGKSVFRSGASLIPYLMVCANIALVIFVLNTQDSNEAREVVMDYQTMEERFTWKLFGDRAAVWKEGWEDCKLSPLVFKDLRQFIVYTPKGANIKMYPHNQFLTLISRDGWWLGLILSYMIFWVQVKAFKTLKYLYCDKGIVLVLIPTGAAIFAVIGTTGQSVATPSLWSNALACFVFPGIVYGFYCCQERAKLMWRSL